MPWGTNLKMQRAVTASVTQSTTTQNTTVVTKSREQILTQSSGAMIAVIVIGIIIILTFLLIVLKTYNRRTHANRMLAVGSAKPRKKVSSTTNTNLAMSNVGASSISESFVPSNASSENGYRIPRVDLANVNRSNGEHFSNNSGSTIVTLHDMPSVDNT
ncbi:noncompact myelin-associated protein-like isoform X1 [Sinocyclocheilus anshuiensis]|uniref:noncompact myelin-associated protein-like isoform X1 n=2 Tax=Sinocyclocheilus anshuiensis TaxID=1608454 RepID=UPI0007BAB3FF|nr:PREDICTED: noncompact myelin-associated protein-like isoform X1 [Sinocyclocheilus anshuiensis]